MTQTVEQVKKYLDGELAKCDVWNHLNKFIKMLFASNSQFQNCKKNGVGQITILTFLGETWEDLKSTGKFTSSLFDNQQASGKFTRGLFKNQKAFEITRGWGIGRDLDVGKLKKNFTNNPCYGIINSMDKTASR